MDKPFSLEKNFKMRFALLVLVLTVGQSSESLQSKKYNRLKRDGEILPPGATKQNSMDLVYSNKRTEMVKNFQQPQRMKIATTVDVGACKLKLQNRSVTKFRHIVYYSEANFAYLRLVPQDGVNITGGRIIVGEHYWTWTFYGKEGGLAFLSWPIEFGIWSMGLMSSFVIDDPMKMELSRDSGNCSNLEVGLPENDQVISNALLSLVLEMMHFSDKYGPSFFCYKTRVYIEPHFVYMLCKHIVCPIEAVKYNCCSYFYNTTLMNRTIDCNREEEFKYDPLSWILPTVVSLILFGFCPIFILYIGHVVSDKGKGHLKGVLQSFARNGDDESVIPTEELVLLDEHHHVTLFKTLCLPIKNCCSGTFSKASKPCKVILRRFWRVFIPFLSVVIIGVQVLLDYKYLNTFVNTSIEKGVPMGFRSMLAGYEGSKYNFLSYLGGPFVAIGIYIFITCMLLLIPNSVSELLLEGLQDNTVDESYSPLCMKLRTIEMFGSISIRRRHGYFKMYSVYLAQFSMLINSKFWKHVVIIQYDRWKLVCCSKLCLLFVPFYIVLCVIEIALCAALYGYPIISFGLMIIKAYYAKLWNQHTRRRFILRMITCVFTVVLIMSVTFFLFMFCTIFMDGCLFVTRVVVFTFTGIVVYPKVSYGYLIFTFTVIYYIWQSIQEYSLVYQRLLKDTMAACERLQRANDTERLVLKSGDYKAIKESLFEHVIENHYPRRKQVVLSVLKVGVILTILGLSINTLIETDGFRELHVVMHVGTALFVCAMPQIVKSMCRDHGQKFKQRRFRKELADTIRNYTGYYTNVTSESDED